MLTKQDKEKCLNIWGCIPEDEIWIKDSPLFKQYTETPAIHEPSPSELMRKTLLKIHFNNLGINYS
jgi:hypothetical protein